MKKTKESRKIWAAIKIRPPNEKIVFSLAEPEKKKTILVIQRLYNGGRYTRRVLMVKKKYFKKFRGKIDTRGVETEHGEQWGGE